MNNTEQKPIFVMKRKKSFMITLYYIFVILWDLATALFFFGLLFNGNIAIKIVAFVFLTTIPCLFFYMFDIKEVICYEDYFIIKKKFFTKKCHYNEFRNEYNIIRTILLKCIVLKYKKIKPGNFINLNMFKKDDINKFIEFLESKNITKYKMFKL
ncbi:hypothetical protein [Campylobacter sputorum]|uniref:hypothetical protein n=1 Tax=Campylobacter sputorum TaxID=206 RepID=UPI001E4C5099|nr:hypothetical protein [Campylobacter sputorum]